MNRIINNRYRLDKELQAGGFGITWLAWDSMLEIFVAIKEYKDPRQKKDGYQKFLTEARKLAKFDNESGIVDVKDFLEEDGNAYLVMEYLDGRDLSEYLASEGKMSFNKAWNQLLPVIHTVERMHKHGMLHRDISPDNIRLLPDGTLKLMDFGSVLDLNADSSKTMTVAVKKGYAPYEQYMDASHQGPWTDVYAVCGTLYKCITGLTPKDALERSFDDRLEKPSSVGADITPEEETVLMKGLAVQPENRFQSLDELEIHMKTGCSAVEASGQQKNSVSDAADQSFRKKSVSNVKTPISSRKNSTKPKRRFPKIPVLAGIAAAAAVTIVIIGFSHQKNPYMSDNNPEYSRLDSVTVTSRMLSTIRRSDTKYLYLSECTIDDSVIESLSSLDKIEKITFSKCTGFSDLSPLSEMKNLKKLSFNSVHEEGSYDNVEIDTETVFAADFSNIEELDISCKDIDRSSSFLEHFPNLKSLIYDVDECNDLTFLQSMPDLETLLFNTDTDLSSANTENLASLTKLKKLIANNTGLSDLSPLAGLMNLSTLEVEQCNIEDLTPLADHLNLIWLDLDDNQIKNIDPLETCDNLYTIHLAQNQISSIEALRGKEGLHYLTVSHNAISDLSPLSESYELADLAAEDNQLTSLSGLENTTSLITVDVSNNQLTDISQLSGNTSLHYLYMDHNQITDISACSTMIELKTLTLNHNQLTDISPLRSCSTIESLWLNSNQISDLSALDNHFTKLKKLNISDNQITSLDALEECSSLQALVGEHNEIENLNGLENKSELYALLLNDNKITNIDHLTGSISKLLYLDLANNQISDISSLRELTANQMVLFLEHNTITDISSLSSNIAFERLTLYGNPIKDVTPISSFAKINPLYNKLYIGYTERMNLDALAGTQYCNYEALHIVDLPLDQQAGLFSLLKTTTNESGNAPIVCNSVFQNTQEADEENDSFRETIRDKVNGDNGKN